MFNNKKEDKNREEFYKKQQDIKDILYSEKIKSFENFDKLLELPTEEKIDVILHLLLLGAKDYYINSIAKKYCNKNE